jgi:transcriptional regulator with XRE-family HTH domain
MAKVRPIHERVHDHVKDAGFTHAQISEMTGWSLQKVYRLLSGKTELTAAAMEKLAVILKRPVASLYRDPEAKAS